MQTINPIPIHTRLNNCEISVAIAAPFIPIGANPHFPNISKQFSPVFTATATKLAANGMAACSLQRSHADKILLIAIGI